MKNQETWILDAIIVTQNSKRRVLKGNIRILNDRIASVGTQKPKRFAKNALKINASGCIVLPGFVQAHVHLCQTLFKNQADDMDLLDWLFKRIWLFEAAHSEKTVYASALLGIHELLSSGTTCILDMATVRHTESILEAVLKTGIRASVGKCLMDHPTTTPEFLREQTRDAVAEALALYNHWHGKANDRIRISYAPRFVISCTEKLLMDVAKLAKEQKALIHTHASENLKEIQLVKELTNSENIEYLQQLGLTGPSLVLAHCIWLKPNEMKILEKTKTNVVHCPSSNLKLASGLARVPEMLQRKINVALGADGAPCNNNLNMFQEMRLAALIHKPGGGPKTILAQEALDMATRNGAKALDWFNDIGSIEVGKKADLLCINANRPENALPASPSNTLDPEHIASSIVYSSQPSHVQWTMIDGNIVYRNGKVASISVASLMKQVHQAQLDVRKQVKKLGV